MSIKISPESRVLDFFQNEPLPVANAIFRLVRENLKRRNASTTEANPTPVKRRKKRTPKPVADEPAGVVA